MNDKQHQTVIGVTEPEYRKGEDIFEQAVDQGFYCIPLPPEEQALARGLKDNGASHAILGIENYSGPYLYEALPSGGVIARFGIGYDGVDTKQATAQGLFCVNTPGVLNQSVSEHAIGLILSLVRKSPVLDQQVKGDTWQPVIGSELGNKTLSIIGCGPIGVTVAQIAAFGFGMQVVGCDIRDMDTEKMCAEYGFSAITSDFAEACQGADFVSLHLPSNANTRHFVNAERLKAIPQEAFLINTARGAILDEKALFHALQNGELAGAALDVFENEPYQPVDPNADLRKLDNVVMTPHVGSSTRDACRRMTKRTLSNIRLAETKQYDEMDLLNVEVRH